MPSSGRTQGRLHLRRICCKQVLRAGSRYDKLPAAWFFVGDVLVKLCFHDSFKQILRLFWVEKKVLRFL